MSLSVLYIHSCGVFGGASRSLMELIQAFPEGSIAPRLITQRGTVTDIFKDAGIPVIECAGITQFDNTRYSHYRGRRWLLLLRESFYLLPTLAAMLRARSFWRQIDLIHVNEVTMPIVVQLAKWIFRKPIVVHVRSMQDQRNHARISWITSVLRQNASAVVAIDDTVKSTLPPVLKVEVVRNGFSAGKCGDLSEQLPPGFPAGDTRIKVAMVGNLLQMKGVHEFIQAASICKQRGIPVQFIIVGHNMRNLSGLKGYLVRKLNFAHDVRSELVRMVEQFGLRKSVVFLDFTTQIKAIYDNIDVLCFPSHLEAVGRPVFEAAFSRVPSIVAINNPQDDTIIHGETGLCIKPRSATSLADAVEHFYRRPDELKRMGEAAYDLALRNFDITTNARQMLSIYHRCLGYDVPDGTDGSLVESQVSY